VPFQEFGVGVAKRGNSFRSLAAISDLLLLLIMTMTTAHGLKVVERGTARPGSQGLRGMPYRTRVWTGLNSRWRRLRIGGCGAYFEARIVGFLTLQSQTSRSND
jgi:hypothetical protein